MVRSPQAIQTWHTWFRLAFFLFFFFVFALETYSDSAQALPASTATQTAPSKTDSLDLPRDEALPPSAIPITPPLPLAPPPPGAQVEPLPEYHPSTDSVIAEFPAIMPFPEVQDTMVLRFPYRPEFLSPAWDSAAKALAAEAAAAAALAKSQGLSHRGAVPIAVLPALLKRPVRVLLHKQAGGMTVDLQGDFGLAKLEGSQAIPQAQVLRGQVTLKFKGRNLEITDASGTKILRNTTGLRLNPARMGSYFTLKGTPYRGSLDLQIESASIQCLAINVLPMDEYLRGVLPYELGRVDASMREALNALAVVARTYAMKRMLRPAAQRFDLYDDVQDQVYKGMKDEYALSDAAVRDTKGQVLLHNDTLVQSYYSSTCAGKTAARHEVWDGAPLPYLVTRDDVNAQGQPFCGASPMMRWQQSWPQDEFVATLRRNYSAGRAEGPKDFKTVRGFEAGETFRCGRLKTLRVLTDAGPVLLRGDRIRWALKPMRTDGRILESARFEISLSGGKVTATGSGFGHGVGLCQYGAMGRAKAGQNYREILTAYFAGTRVVEYR